MSELPSGWVRTTIGEIIKVKSGDSLSSKDRSEGNIPVFGGNGITGYHNSNNLDEPSIVIGRVGFYCGSVHLTPKNAWVTDNAFKVIYSKDCLDFRFLYWLLVSTDLRQNTSSTAQPVISGSKIYPIPIALPPLNEQKRIVEKLDQLFAHLDSLKNRLDHIPELLKQFRQSVLTEAVTGKLTEEWRVENYFHLNESLLQDLGEGEFRSTKGIEIPDNWAWMSFDSVAMVKSNLVQPNDYKDHFLIAPDNIESKTGKLISKPLVSDINPKSAKHLFEEGSIVYSKIRPYLSKLIIADFKGLCSADMYPIGVKEVLEIKYLYFYMLSDIYLDFANSAGSRSVLPKINQKELGIIPISVPPIEEQIEIVRRTEDLFEKADLIERQYERTKERIAHLPEAILSKAFQGKLVPQDPNDEPAEELLKRIIEFHAGSKEGKKKSHLLLNLKFV